MGVPMPRMPSRLESHLGYWLRFVSNHVSHAFKLKVESLGVTVAEWVVLRTLFDLEAVNPSKIAELIGMTRGAVSKLLDRLAGKGLVIIRTDKSDRRFQAVALSASGRRIVPVIAALADQNELEFFGQMNQKERDGVLALLKRIVNDRNLKAVPVD